MKNSLRQGLGLHIQKSYVEGVYSDNSQNKKLGRVGMSYGHSLNLEGFEDVEDSEEGYASNPNQSREILDKVNERICKFR